MNSRHRNACFFLAAALVLASCRAVCEAETLHVGLYENKPKVFTDSEGHAAGIFVDLLKEIAGREGWVIVYVPCEWAECLRALESGRIDLMPDVAYSQDRDGQYDFHRIPVAESWSQVYSNAGVPVSRISDLDGRRVALLKDSIQQKALQQTIEGFGFDVEVVPAGSFEEAFGLVRDGSADAAITNHFFGDFFYQDYGLAKSTIVFNVVSLYFATAQGRNSVHLRAIDRYLGEWVKQPDSPYYRTLGRWAEKPPKHVVPRYFLFIFCAVGGLLFFAFGTIRLLRRQVASRTRHLSVANEELKKTEELLNLALEATRDGVWDWRPKTGQIYWSPSSYALFGYNTDEFEMNVDLWSELLHPEDGERTLSEIERQVEGGARSFSVEFRQRRKDGGWMWINGRGKAVELDETGGALRVMGILSDITERKRAEEELGRYREHLEELVAERTGELERTQEQLIQSQKMQAVGQLAGGISHNFNNMLAIILSTSELVLGNMRTDSPNYQRISRIIKTGNRARELTGRLLAFARKEKLEISRISAKSIIMDVVDILTSSITKKIIIQTDFPEEDVPIYCDANQLGQALLNICINSCEAMKEGGTLKLEMARVSIAGNQGRAGAEIKPGDYCVVKVVDEGCGIPREALNRIYEPFYTTKEKCEGTGLGLSVTEGIVKMHNGHVSIESELGKGTVVSVYLPVAADAAGPADAGAAEAPPGNRETILVVDDERDFTDMMADFLDDHGYRPVIANSGREAIEIFKENPVGIDLVILDIMMPEMDGGEVCRDLRAVRPDVKIVLCSGFSADGKARELISLGNCIHVQKPFDNQRLLEAVAGMLGK